MTATEIEMLNRQGWQRIAQMAVHIEGTLITPTLLKLMQIFEQQEISERVSALLGHNAEYDAVRYPR